MIPVRSMTEEEIDDVAQAFADYPYAEGERGLIDLFPGREQLLSYLKVMVRCALRSQMVYTNSENREGFIVITDTTRPMRTGPMLSMFLGMIKALGVKGFSNYVKHCQSGGGSIEMKFRKEKRPFIQVEMLAVRKKYQGQGHMRGLLENAFALARQKGLPCILVTDAALKKDKYVHLGMELVNTRKVGEGSYLYDLLREPCGQSRSASSSLLKNISSSSGSGQHRLKLIDMVPLKETTPQL